jgi:hypothetical protein
VRSDDPIEVLNYALEELGHTPAELAEAVVRVGNPLGLWLWQGPLTCGPNGLFRHIVQLMISTYDTANHRPTSRRSA